MTYVKFQDVKNTLRYGNIPSIVTKWTLILFSRNHRPEPESSFIPNILMEFSTEDLSKRIVSKLTTEDLTKIFLGFCLLVEASVKDDYMRILLEGKYLRDTLIKFIAEHFSKDDYSAFFLKKMTREDLSRIFYDFHLKRASPFQLFQLCEPPKDLNPLNRQPRA